MCLGIFSHFDSILSLKSMPHAIPAYLAPSAQRSNTIINYYLDPGKYYNKYLLTENSN